MIFVLPVVLLAMMTGVAASAWWCMSRRADHWARFVDRENDFWRKRKIISASLAEKMKRWEKSDALKLTAAVTTCAGVVGVVLTSVVLVRAMQIEHQRPRYPVNPALHIKVQKPK